MPQLTGSERQVAWANDIRAEVLKNADNIVKGAQSDIGLTSSSGKEISPDGAKAMREQIYNMLSKATEAKQVINFKQQIRNTYDYLSRWADQETRKQKK